MANWNAKTVVLYTALGLATFMLALAGLRWWGMSPDLAFWLGWFSSQVWVSVWAWFGGTRWRRGEFARRLTEVRREFEAAQDLTRLEVYLRRASGSLQVHHLVPTTKEGVPLMNAADVTRELAHAAALLAQGRNWSVRETGLDRTQYMALRDRLVAAGFLYPVRERQPVQWTADADGGGLALLEAAARGAGFEGVAQEISRLRVPVCAHGTQNRATQAGSGGVGDPVDVLRQWEVAQC